MKSGTRYWMALYTRPFHEFKVREILKRRGCEVFLPTRLSLDLRFQRKCLVEVPLFRSYVFLRAEPKSPEFYFAMNLPGVVYALSKNGLPLEIPEVEIQSLRILVESRYRDQLISHPRLIPGQCVVVTRGPFQGARGVVQRLDRETLHFVVNIHLLGQSVSVAVEPDWLKLC